MNAELESYSDQLLSVKQDAVGLMSGLSDAQFNWPPAPGRWSMAGCFDHLNKTAAAIFIPSIDAAIADGRARGLKSDGPFNYSALERWFVKTQDAPARTRFKAAKKTQPSSGKPVHEVREEFLRWQDALVERILDADGLDLRRAKHYRGMLPAKFSLGSLIQMMLAHERRHTDQARQVRQHPEFP